MDLSQLAVIWLFFYLLEASVNFSGPREQDKMRQCIFFVVFERVERIIVFQWLANEMFLYQKLIVTKNVYDEEIIW